MAQGLRHSADLSVAPFPQLNLQKRAVTPGPQPAHPSGAGQATIQRQTPPPAIEDRLRRHTLDPHPVGLGVAVTRVGEFQGELTQIGEQKRTMAVGIQTANGVKTSPMLRGKQVQHRAATLRVIAAADHPHRLVDQQHPRHTTGRQRLTIHMNRLLLRIGLVANAGDLTIHRHAAGLQPFLSPAPGAEAGSSDQFLQALARHCRGSRGRSRSMQAPPAGWLRASMRPPWLTAICCTIASPRPLPLRLERVREGSPR